MFKIFTKIILPTLILAALSTTACLLVSRTASAVSGSDWQAGNIVNDSLFYDNTAMSTDDIQNFMNKMAPNCDTNGTQIHPGTSITNAQYAASQGWPGPPYTCLKNYFQVPRSDQNINNFQGRSIPAGAISAAQIIKNAADNYGISPKALLTTLQKESPGPLLTDYWPLDSQYKNAMGYGCPDTAPCDPVYEGFYNQMTNAARQFKLYKDNQGSYRYKPFQANQVYYNPNYACGSTDVYIANYATAGLYNYTPYQPNDAALKNLYGLGDGCSAYGNRNFWRIFHDWFESDYLWQASSQGIYTDTSLSTLSNPTGLVANQPERQYVTIKVKNIGMKTWTKGNVSLGTSQPQNRGSAIYDSTWLSPNRPATLSEASVASGDYGTFSFWINTPRDAGNYKEYFNVVAEGITWMNDMGLYLQLEVKPAIYTWTPSSQLAYTDATKQTIVDLSNLVAGDTAYMVVKVQNTGNTTWHRYAVNLGTSGPYDRASQLSTTGWLSKNRAAALQEQIVLPGGVGTFEYTIKIPAGGVYKEYFDLVLENVAWMKDIGFYYNYSAAPAQYTWQPSVQSAYTDASKTVPVDTTKLSPGQTIYLEIKAKNTGNTKWRNGLLNIGTASPYDRTSSYYDSRWLASNRPASVNEGVVNPGEVGTFDFWVKAPNNTGTKREYFNFVAENISWLNDLGLYYQFTVK